MVGEKYILINYDDLTDDTKKHLDRKSTNEPINFLELKKGKTGFLINQRPI